MPSFKTTIEWYDVKEGLPSEIYIGKEYLGHSDGVLVLEVGNPHAFLSHYDYNKNHWFEEEDITHWAYIPTVEEKKGEKE